MVDGVDNLGLYQFLQFLHHENLNLQIDRSLLLSNRLGPINKLNGVLNDARIVTFQILI